MPLKATRRSQASSRNRPRSRRSSASPALALLVGLLVAAGGWRVADAGSRTGSPHRPNVVFILVDDLGWSDLGVQGSRFYETPNIDRLAEQGLRFLNAYASAPVCSPTRAALLTGKHPARLQMTDWIPGDNPLDRPLMGPAGLKALPLEEITLAEALRAEGYATFLAGKWHLGGNGYSPENQGFDFNHGGVGLGRPPGGYYSPYRNPALADGPEGEYLTDRLTDEALSFIDANQDRPFFVFLPYYAVHTPLQGADRHIQRFARRLETLAPGDVPEQRPEHEGWTKQRQDNIEYASMIHALDENLGRIVARLHDLGLAGRTYVIFTSDNGGRATLPAGGDATSNLPLRAGKGWLYEGGIRVPLIVKGPRVINATSEALVVSTDYYPTILELVGAELLTGQHLDGISFAPVLGGTGRGVRDSVFFHYPHYHGSASSPSSALRRGDWKLVQFHESGKVELYDLGEDIGETTDLAQAEPERARSMLEALERWKAGVGAAQAVRNPAYAKAPAGPRALVLDPGQGD